MDYNNNEILIARIKKCNLANNDKEILIEILKEKNVDKSKFIRTLIDILKLSKEGFKFLDIDF